MVLSGHPEGAGFRHVIDHKYAGRGRGVAGGGGLCNVTNLHDVMRGREQA